MGRADMWRWHAHLHHVASCFVGAILFISLAVTPSQALTPQRIAAIVNEDVVSFQDLVDRLQLVLVTSGVPDNEEARTRLAPQVLRGLIEEELQLQEAERLGISVEPPEIEQALQNIADRNDLDPAQLQQFLSQSGVEFETLIKQIRAQIAWVKVVNREVRPRVNVSIDQLELAVQDFLSSLGQPEYLISEIVLPVDTPEQEGRVARDARRLVQTVSEGASFYSLARQVSAAASAERGGDLGWVTASVIPPELIGALEALRPGDVSAPIRSSVGYHIFWLRDRRVGEARPANEDLRVRLAQILIGVGAVDGADTVENAFAEAAALRPALEDCEAMVETAQDQNLPASGELGWLQIGELPPEFARAVATLPIGEVSAPLRGPSGVHLLMVCDREGDGGIASADRDEIEQRLENERIDRLARRYLRDLRKEAFVELRL